jgi:hypothetical protein
MIGPPNQLRNYEGNINSAFNDVKSKGPVKVNKKIALLGLKWIFWGFQIQFGLETGN